MADTTRRARIILEARDEASRVLAGIGGGFRGLGDAKTSLIRKTSDLDKAVAAERKSLIDSAQSGHRLSESLSRVSSQKDVARIAAQRLDAQVRGNQITVAQYNDAIGQLHAKYDLSSEAGRKAADSLKRLNSDFAAGKIGAEQYAAGLEKIKISGGGLPGILSGIGGMAKLAFAGLAAGAVAGIAASIKLGMSMEQTRIAFKTMLGSAEAARKHLEELRAFADKTPFRFSELTVASRRLQAFGFEAEKIIPMLRDIGDAAAAMGGSADIINRVTIAIGQMSAKGKVSAQEMLQLTEAGIPAWRYLAEGVGVTTAEVQKMTEKGLVPASQAIELILSGMRQDFGGMMEEQAKTAAGQMSTLQDSIEGVAVTLGEALLPALKSMIGVAQEGADALKLLVNWEKNLHDVFTTHQADMFKLVTAQDETRISVEEYNREILRSGQLTGDATKIADELTAMIREQYTATELARLGFADMSDGIYKVSQNVNLLTDAELEAYQAGVKWSEGVENATLRVRGLIPATEEETKVLERLKTGMMNSQVELKDLSGEFDALKTIVAGPVGKAFDDFTQKESDLIAKQKELQGNLRELEEQHGRVVTATGRRKLSEAELTLETIKLTEAQAKLAETSDPKKQAELAVQIEKLQEKLGGATGATQAYIDKSKEMDAIKGQLSEIDAALLSNRQNFEENIKRMIFEQLIASVGDFTKATDAQRESITEIAKTFGIWDESTATLMNRVPVWATQLQGMTKDVGDLDARKKGLIGSVMNYYNSVTGQAIPATDQYNDRLKTNFDRMMEIEDATGRANKNTDLFALSVGDAGGALEDAAGKVDIYAGKLQSLPTSHTFRLKIETEGALPTLPAGAAPIALQHGGQARQDRAYIVGERGPEYFIPRMPGFVVNQQQAAMAVGAVHARGEPQAAGAVTVNVTVNPAPGMDERALAQAVSVELARRLRSARASGLQYMAQ